MVEGVEVVVVGHVVRDDLGVHDVALALLADFVQSLMREEEEEEEKLFKNCITKNLSLKSCTSIMPHSDLKRFQSVLVLQNQSAFF